MKETQLGSPSPKSDGKIKKKSMKQHFVIYLMNHCLQPTTASNCHVVSRVPYSLKVLKASNFFYIHTQKVRDCAAMQNVNTSLLLRSLQLYTGW